MLLMARSALAMPFSLGAESQIFPVLLRALCPLQ